MKLSNFIWGLLGSAMIMFAGAAVVSVVGPNAEAWRFVFGAFGLIGGAIMIAVEDD